ncbi:unnamed protein product [Xylocopa violacea]|uniref:Uncharacterized protein n=1 Tax=Xylocopa violacea TaxID=135666 RepID=A0ABP1NMH9_XYLVO
MATPYRPVNFNVLAQVVVIFRNVSSTTPFCTCDSTEFYLDISVNYTGVQSVLMHKEKQRLQRNIPGRTPEKRDNTLLIPRLLLTVSVDDVTNSSCCILSSSSHCCISAVISLKDTNCGMVVSDRFLKTSLASSGSLKTIRSNVLLACKILILKCFEHSLYFDQVAIVQFVIVPEIDNCHSLVIIVNGSDLVCLILDFWGDTVQSFENVLEESRLLIATIDDYHNTEHYPTRGAHVCPRICMY